MIQFNLKRYARRLLALADHIETIPEDLFTMVMYRKDGHDTIHDCGTIGCILGHAPMVIRKLGGKIPLGKIPLEYATYEWEDPIRINFGDVAKWFGVKRNTQPNHTMLWKYLFDSDWATTDNTPIGAAKRIRWVVNNGGIPSNWQNQMFDDAPLSYMEETI